MILILGTANSQLLQHIILEPQKVSVSTTKSGHTYESTDQVLADNHLALSIRMDQQHQLLRDRMDALGKFFLTLM